MTRPVVFMTDYGLADEFVGVCRGVMLRIAPDVRVIDLTHAIPRQDVVRGAMSLGRATAFMPSDAVYLAVVDPGVGSTRRAVAVSVVSGSVLVGPDNGVLSLAIDALGGADSAVEITSPTVVLHPVSRTFHGRDVFAPAAARVAAGMDLVELGPPVDPSGLVIVDLPTPVVAPGSVGARVIGVDTFGNVQLNVGPGDLDAAGLGGVLSIGGRAIPRVGVFADAPEGAPAAMVDSNGQLALMVNRGSAAELLGLAAGDTVVLE